MYVCMYVCVRVCVYVCVYLYDCLFIHGTSKPIKLGDLQRQAKLLQALHLSPEFQRPTSSWVFSTFSGI
jgi:hypothetical protein